MKKFILILLVFLFQHQSFSQQLINGSFEEWETEEDGSNLKPQNWSTDIFATLHHNPVDSAKEGKNAIVISTWYSYVTGHLFYGNVIQPHERSWKEYTVPFTGKPEKLIGYFRYTHLVSPLDSARGQILIKDENEDSLAYGAVLLHAVDKWTKFEIKLTYLSEKKASAISIHFKSRNHGGNMNHDSYPNRLYLDDLKFIYPNNKAINKGY